MWLSKKTKLLINSLIWSISALVWVLLLINPGNIMTVEHCLVLPSPNEGATAYFAANIPLCTEPEPSLTPLEMLLEMNPFHWQLLGWGLMVIAMMLPKLSLPIQFVYLRSLPRFRGLNCSLFSLGYLLAWMVAGVFLLIIIMACSLWMPFSYVPALIAFAIALVWQFSPSKQHFLNRGHDHWNMAAFGWKAFRDAFLFGGMHGVWCIGAGWALMLFPMLLPEGHNLAMLVVTFIMLSEHLEHPKAPRWEIDCRLRMVRALVAQVGMKWKGLFASN